MEALTLQTIAEYSGARIVQGDPGRVVARVCTDTRQVEEGDLFLALVGENFDGNDFVGQAVESGAGAVLVSTAPEDDLDDRVTILQVEDTLVALQELARRYLLTLPLRVVAVTGSNGKTSTKDMIAEVLSERFRVTSTVGNFNNHIGLPLSILKADKSYDYGVFEMGMNHPGEIAALAGIARPDIAVITNAGLAHIGNMGSREAIAIEKADLARAVPPEGDIVLPAEDEMLALLEEGAHAPITLTGMAKGDFTAKVSSFGIGASEFVVTEGSEHSTSAKLPVSGEHMIRNALMAIAVGRLAGIPLVDCAAALGRVRLTGGRLQPREVRGITFIDDSYNANPDSVVAALSTLAHLSSEGKKVAVLGAMGELGEATMEGYRRVGTRAAAEELDGLVVVGESASTIASTASASGLTTVIQSSSVESAAKCLDDLLSKGDVVLVKGSRAARMDRVIEVFESLGGVTGSL